MRPRLALLALVTSGCGRIDFDALRDGGVIADVPMVDAASALGTFGSTGLNATTALAPFRDGGVAVAILFAGDVTIGGTTYTSLGATDMLLGRLAPDGTIRWMKQLGSAGDDLPSTISVAPDDTIYLGGTTLGAIDFGGGVLANQADDGFVASFTGEGAYRWSRLIGGSAPTGPYGVDSVHTITASASGIVVAGHVAAQVDFGGMQSAATGGLFDAFTATYSADGTLGWVRRWGYLNYNNVSSSTVAASGNIYVGVYYEGTPDFGGSVASGDRGIQDAAILAYSPTGTLRWARDFGGSGFDRANGVAVDANENVYFTGYFEADTNIAGGLTAVGGRDALVGSYDAAGTFRWAQRHGSTGCDLWHRVRLVGSSLLLAGRFGGTFDVGLGATPIDGSADGVIGSISATGSVAFARRVGTAGADDITDVAGTDLTSVFIGGAVAALPDAGCGGAGTTDPMTETGLLDRILLP